MIVAGSPILPESLAEGLPFGMTLEFTARGRALLVREPDLFEPARIIVGGLSGLRLSGTLRFDGGHDPESSRETLVGTFLVARPWREVLAIERDLDRDLDPRLDGWHDRALYMLMPQP